MSKERSTDNPQAAFIPATTVEAYTFQIRKIVTSLARYDASRKAQDVAAVLTTALLLLSEGESAISPIADSPGVDDDGNPLPPFTPMTLPGS